MPLPVTKVVLSTAIASGGGYSLLPNTIGDFFGNVTGDPASWLSSIGDLNGDGLQEIVTGAMSDDKRVVDGGRIFINYGQSVTSPADKIDNPLVQISIDASNAGDLAGSSVGSSTDLNGDGLSEILVGAKGFDDGALIDNGAAFVLWGNADGTDYKLRDPYKSNNSGVGYIIKGEASGDAAGTAIASISDMNGDGKAETLVGATGNDAGGLDAGAAYVVWGKSTGTAVSLAALGAGGFKITGENAGDKAGTVVTQIADQNGDGIADILVGATGNDGGGAEAGAVYVVYGKANSTTVNLDNIAAGIGGYKISGTAGCGHQDTLLGRQWRGRRIGCGCGVLDRRHT